MNELTSRYAMSLYLLKKESGTLIETQDTIKELIEILKQYPDYPLVLNSSYLPKEKRIDLVEEAFSSVDEEIKNFIKVIVNNGRGSYLTDIFEDFSSLVNKYRNIKEGLLYSSEPLSKEQINKITMSVSEKEDCEIELKNIVDPSLIGGIKVVINDHIYDGSLKHQIEMMNKALLGKGGKI